MIRLIFFCLIFGAGIYAGTELSRVRAVDACLNAGGGWDARGFCSGVR